MNADLVELREKTLARRRVLAARWATGSWRSDAANLNDDAKPTQRCYRELIGRAATRFAAVMAPRSAAWLRGGEASADWRDNRRATFSHSCVLALVNRSD